MAGDTKLDGSENLVAEFRPGEHFEYLVQSKIRHQCRHHQTAAGIADGEIKELLYFVSIEKFVTEENLQRPHLD